MGRPKGSKNTTMPVAELRAIVEPLMELLEDGANVLITREHGKGDWHLEVSANWTGWCTAFFSAPGSNPSGALEIAASKKRAILDPPSNGGPPSEFSEPINQEHEE